MSILGDEIRETTISLNAKNHPKKTLATTQTLREDQAQFVPLNSSFSKILGVQTHSSQGMTIGESLED